MSTEEMIGTLAEQGYDVKVVKTWSNFLVGHALEVRDSSQNLVAVIQFYGRSLVADEWDAVNFAMRALLTT